MAKRVGENQVPPSYTTQVPVFRPNKSLKRETVVVPDTENSPAISGANRRVVTKESRKTGRK